jgi:acetyl-CoA carboxylase/biotin carboxylase 1
MAEINGNGTAPHNSNGKVVPIMNGSTSYAAKHQLADHFIGGNKLENAPPSNVKDFVASHDGHTVITNVRWARKIAPGSTDNSIRS